MDISQTTAPKSDQQNFDDYVAGPKTVTISEVRAGSSEQPVEIHLAEFPGRPYKPSKSMRRVLVAAWGPESAPWPGRRMTLVGDPTVKFGGIVVGGIKIAALSDIDKRLTINLTVTKGKRAPHVVEPLPDAPKAPTEADVAGCTDEGTLRGWWGEWAALRPVIEARVAELKQPTTEPDTQEPAS
jgi:hypothetical protein